MKTRRKPDWLKIQLPHTYNFTEVNRLVKQNGLNTICVSGKCPNLGYCWDHRTATLMILGDICTRACRFCAVKTGKPLPPDKTEPIKVARSVKSLGIKHCVLTSVDRDDLPDKGAGHWAETIKQIKKLNPDTTIEALIPDFDADENLIKLVIEAGADVVSHNLETVERLTPKVRSRATYRRSLKVIEIISKYSVVAKSGIMVGLGETINEVLQTMDDLLNAGCEVLTIGQYLQPTPKNIPVAEYVKPEIFDYYKKIGLEKGFKYVESAPLVRSSYNAHKHVLRKNNVNTGKIL